MDLVLDMYSHMDRSNGGICVSAQLTPPNGEPGTDSQGDSDKARHDGAVGSSSAQVAAGCMESSLTIMPREAEGHVSELVRRKMTRHLRQAPLRAMSLSW